MGRGRCQGTHGIDAPSGGPHERVSAVLPELRHERRLRQADEVAQCPDVQALEPGDHLVLDRQRLHRAARKEAGERRVIHHHHRSTRRRPRRRRPRPERPRRVPDPVRRHEGTREHVEERAQHRSELVLRRSVQPPEPVHPQEDLPALDPRFDDRRAPRERLEDRLDGGVVVRRVGVEQGQRGAERDRLRDQLTRTYARIPRPLRDLPERAPGALAGGEQGDRGRVEVGEAHQLEPELEGRKPEAGRHPAAAFHAATNSGPGGGRGRGRGMPDAPMSGTGRSVLRVPLQGVREVGGKGARMGHVVRVPGVEKVRSERPNKYRKPKIGRRPERCNVEA